MNEIGEPKDKTVAYKKKRQESVLRKINKMLIHDQLQKQHTDGSNLHQKKQFQ
jgi:hypothetical protein